MWVLGTCSEREETWLKIWNGAHRGGRRPVSEVLTGGKPTGKQTDDIGRNPPRSGLPGNQIEPDLPYGNEIQDSVNEGLADRPPESLFKLQALS